ncbi:HNH endonuclease [Bacillus cereus]|uniref:HNH endonuclease n=1 Tax=Bacillus cereus TaxID=1396 RepID=UPI00211DA085|nr:HNH endonuclease [Bacillus cereus]
MRCRSNVIIKIGDVVDYIIPIRVNWSRRLDPVKLQTLCLACHNQKTRDAEKAYKW